MVTGRWRFDVGRKRSKREATEQIDALAPCCASDRYLVVPRTPATMVMPLLVAEVSLSAALASFVAIFLRG
jgi:ABC-type transporter Mla maintaining outer membrane lipid asymmetry permease subunit MlaE